MHFPKHPHNTKPFGILGLVLKEVHIKIHKTVLQDLNQDQKLINLLLHYKPRKTNNKTYLDYNNIIFMYLLPEGTSL